MEVTEETVIEHSEDENDLNLINTSRVRKRAKIIDSDDSEGEGPLVGNIDDVELSEEDTVTDLSREPLKKTRLKRITRIDSDSDDEENISKNDSVNLEDTKEGGSVLKGDSSDVEDVVDEEDVAPHNKSFPNEETAVEAVIYSTNTKGELIREDAPLHTPSLSALCDSESEEEIESDVVEATMDETVQPAAYKKSRRKNQEENPPKMTAQDAAKQRLEISSESQRMVRETNVSLPYHKPKSYTIKEFLQRRSKLTPAKAPPSVAIKMSKDQLEEVSKKLNERIKEVEEFYKSDDSEDDEEEDDASEDIRIWLDVCLHRAMDEVEEKSKEEEKDAEISKESLEYDFSLDDINEEDARKKQNISEIIKDKLKGQPRLTGTADDIIDLDEGVTKLSRVRQLVDRFFQHTARKIPHKHQVQLNVLEVSSGGEIVKETVSVNVDEEEEAALVETPGAKLQKLRVELQQQMAQKRLELWKQKRDCLTAEKKDGYENDAEDDILDDEEEEVEMTESESEPEDEEAEEEKPKAKSAFLDEEADEDNDEEMEEDNEEPEDDDEADDEGDAEQAKEELESPKKKILKRILKPLSLDSDDEDEEQSQIAEPATVLKYYATDEDDVMPPNLPRVGKTPQRTQLDKSKSEFDFLTPVTYLTGLQNLNSDSKFLQESPFAVPDSQESNSQPQSQVPKKLFPDVANDEAQDTQGSMEDLAQLCSGTFPQTQNFRTVETGSAEELPCTQDLLNLCSGDFTSQEQGTEKIIIHEVVKILPTQSSQREIKCLDEEQDQIISQLLDEEELERFKKRFESPVNPVVRKPEALESLANAEEVNATGFISSDDENEELEVKQKKRKKLMFSDDEDDDEDEEPEEEIELRDDVDDEELQLENEVAAGKYQLADFLDKEAELSESEWGSADEDEKDLDELEFEEGDQEKFNENKMRSEIERIHMRQILDEDNREVKLLQELLLEDGEMHGTGRKRQFRWKALDSGDNGEFEKRDDDEVFLDEEESEEQWRKMRHKREMFLKKKSNVEDDDNSILSDGGILKIGQQVFKNTSFSSQNSTPVNRPEEDASPLTLLNKRGSFLSRKDQVLQRLAEYNKVTQATVGATAKNSKSFVFQRVGAGGLIKDNNNKRKAAEGTPNAVKKLRLSDLSPAVGTKGSKAKKLFGNW